MSTGSYKLNEMSKTIEKTQEKNKLAEHLPQNQIRVGVSACLLGAKVRFDGGHKRDNFVAKVLSEYFDLVSYCPEVAAGLGTPRPTIRLVGDIESPRVVGVKDASLDVTQQLRDYSRSACSDMDDLCGFIVKRGSPSCGLERVKVYNDKGHPQAGGGTGVFTTELLRSHPLMPVEEEGRLNDASIRENFMTRVYVFARWKALMANGLTKGGLQAFHAQHKYLLMAHSQEGYRELGRMLANLKQADLQTLADDYIAGLMTYLQQRSNRKRHANVLQHLLGYLRRGLDEIERADLVETIDAYRRGLHPLVVPIKMLKHHFRKHPDAYIDQQVYLNPHPYELGLRNQI